MFTVIFTAISTTGIFLGTSTVTSLEYTSKYACESNLQAFAATDAEIHFNPKTGIALQPVYNHGQLVNFNAIHCGKQLTD